MYVIYLANFVFKCCHLRMRVNIIINNNINKALYKMYIHTCAVSTEYVEDHNTSYVYTNGSYVVGEESR